MTTRVKICGISEPAGFDACVEAAADWVGFVFFARSPRAVTPAEAARISARSGGGPGRVGLFVDPSDQEVAAALAALPLDALQLYAGADRAADLRARFGVPVWRAVAVDGAGSLPSRADGADLLVLEAKPPPEARRPGGNAARFDWSVLHGWTAPAPWILAGGLNPENVGAAIRSTGAGAVDVSSGVEIAPGRKDPARIRAFLAAARGALPRASDPSPAEDR